MKMRRFLICILAAALSAGMLSACGADNGALKWIKKPSSWEEHMNNAKINSLTSLGNTFRIKKAIEKARNGEDVNICYIGGSITEGEHLDTCYANRSYEYFRDTFGTGDNVHYFNAGISGTPSGLGALRFEKDVLSNDPDIIFIEFAVNDGGDSDTKAAFEAMIRDAIDFESKPAIILLFARGVEGYSSQDWKKEIGAFYDVSMISYADGITYLLDSGAMQWSEFSNDGVHPNANGNSIVAEFISYFYSEADRAEVSEEDIVKPEKGMNPDFYYNAHMIEKTDAEPEDMGSWQEGSTGFHYDQGWTKRKSEDNDPLVFEFEGRCAYVVYPVAGQNSYGNLVCDVYFNGEHVSTKYFNEYAETGWNSPYTGALCLRASSGSYRLEFRAADGDEKSDLQVLAIAYTD